EWNWQALSHQANSRYGLKTTDRQLKQLGKDNLAEYLTEEATKSIEALDLNDGQPYLGPDWGARSLCDWARLKYSIKLAVEEVTGQPEDEIKTILGRRVRELYRQKEVEFPVKAGMAQFMSERAQAQAGGSRYNREGLFAWSRERFAGYHDRLSEEDF